MNPAREPALPGMRLTTYLELEKIVQAFARGHLRLLILIGGHGLGKSRIVRQALTGPSCWLEGSLSVFGLYCQLWQHRNLPVVLDDVDGWYGQREGVRLLKCLTQSEPIKSVSWHTDAPTLQRQAIPQAFRTASRVAIIANEWMTLNRNVAALEDRGHLLFFEPSPLEVHRRTASWYWDQEIFDFLGARLPWLAEASMRHYLAAWELKQAGLDWRRLILSRCLSGRALLVAQVKADPQYGSEAERVQAFLAAGGGSRSSYFNWSQKLQAPVTAPAITLRNPPPVAKAADTDLFRNLGWRHDATLADAAEIRPIRRKQKRRVFEIIVDMPTTAMRCSRRKSRGFRPTPEVGTGSSFAEPEAHSCEGVPS